MAETVGVNIKINGDTSKAQQDLQKLDKILGEVIGKLSADNIAGGIDKANGSLEEQAKKAQRVVDLFDKAVSLEEQMASIQLDGGIDIPDGMTPSIFEESQERLENLNETQSESIEINQDFIKSLLNMASSGKVSAKGLEGLAASAGVSSVALAAVSAEITIIVGALKLFVDQLKDTINVLKSVGVSAFDVMINGAEYLIDIFQDAINFCTELNDSMKELAETGAEIEDAFFNMYTILGQEAGDGIVNITNELETLYGLDGTTLLKDMKQIAVAARSLGGDSGAVTQASKNMAIMANDLSMLAGSFEKAADDIGNAISKGFVGRGSSLYMLMTKQEKEYLSSLNTEVERYNYLMGLSDRINGRYADYMETNAGKIALLNNRISALKGNIGQLALGLYAKVAPLLTKIVDICNKVVLALMKIFNINTQSDASIGAGSLVEVGDSIKKGMDEATEATKKTKKEIKKSGDEIEKVKKQVAGFDDVYQINDNEKSGFDSDDFDLDDEPIDDIDDLTESLKNFDLALQHADEDSEDFWDKLKNDLESGELLNRFKKISDELKKALQSIDWKDIQDKARLLGKAIGTAINGLFYDVELGKEVGNFFAQTANTITYGFNDLLKTVDFAQLGKWFGASWKEFWTKLDTKTMGENIALALKGAFTFIQNWLDEGDGFKPVAEKLADLINGLFSNLSIKDVEDGADTIIAFINNIFESVGTFLENVDIEDMKDKLKAFIKRLMKGFSENAGDWGETLNDLITTVLDTLIELLETADKSGLKKGISDFLEKLNLGEIMAKFLELKFKVLWSITRTKLQVFFSAIGGYIGEALKTLGSIIAALIVWIGAMGWTAIETVVKGFFIQLSEAKKNLLDFFKAIGTWLGAQATVFGNEVSGFIVELLNKFNISDKFREKGKNIINGLLNGIKEAWNALKSWWNTHIAKTVTINKPQWLGGGTYNWQAIPRLATGGIVSKSTVANIGEAGKEAVLPLDRNTQWMDSLANKLASKMNSTGAGGSVTMDMSGCQKNFYTRAEMLEFGKMVVEGLKVYGVNISVAY